MLKRVDDNEYINMNIDNISKIYISPRESYWFPKDFTLSIGEQLKDPNEFINTIEKTIDKLKSLRFYQSNKRNKLKIFLYQQISILNSSLKSTCKENFLKTCLGKNITDLPRYEEYYYEMGKFDWKRIDLFYQKNKKQFKVNSFLLAIYNKEGYPYFEKGDFISEEDARKYLDKLFDKKDISHKIVGE